MIIAKRSPLTGILNKRNIDITFDEYNEWLDGGIPIQMCFPNLSEDDREFLLTGLLPSEWDIVCPDV